VRGKGIPDGHTLRLYRRVAVFRAGHRRDL